MASIMKGRIVAITGGASGIGLSTAKLLASRGARISIADTCQPKHLETALAEIRAKAHGGDDVMTYQCDVSKADQVRKWLNDTKGVWGRVDHAANIAGVWSEASIGDIEEKEWDLIHNVNLKGSMNVLKASIKLMDDHADCSLVLASSVCGLIGVRGNAAYCASKHGVIGLTKGAAIDVGGRGIRVNCVAPGMVDTPLARDGPGLEFAQAFSSQTPIGRIGDPSEIAGLIAFLLGKDSSFLTGGVYTADGGALA